MEHPTPQQPGHPASPTLTSKSDEPASFPASTSATETYAPTPTSSTGATGTSPPPPQPGARPEPVPQPQQTGNPAIPPPPKAGEVPTAAPQIHAAAQGQMSTATSSPYQQYQQQQQVPYHRPTASGSTSTAQPLNYGYPFSYAYGYRPGTQPGSEAGGSIRAPGEASEEDSIYNTAMSWLQSAGTKLAEVEAAVWKRINDAHDGK